MNKYKNAALLIAVLVLTGIGLGVFFFSSDGRAPHRGNETADPAAETGKRAASENANIMSRRFDIEGEADSLGDFLLRAEAGALRSEDGAAEFGSLFHELAPIIAEESLCRKSGRSPELKGADERDIYGFLFGRGEDVRSFSYRQLKKSLCFDRLMRMGEAYFRDKASLKREYLHCPISKEAYTAAEGHLLRCSGCALEFDNAGRRMIGSPEELYRQLSMGYYNEKRSHGLDRYILGSAASAVRPGEIVAEIGCGVGCYTDSLSAGAAPDGKVLAMDVDESVLEFVGYTAERRHNALIETKLVRRDDPCLAPGSVDRIYMIDILNVMTGIDIKNNGCINADSRAYLQKLYAALKPGGSLVVVDFYPFADCPHILPEKVTEIMSELKLKRVEAADIDFGMQKMYALTFRK